jgi:predicted PurR-regulated permease PerM
VFTLAFLVFGGLIALFVPMLIAQGNALVDSAPEILERIRTFGPIQWAEEQFNITEKLREGAGDQAGSVAQPALAFAGGVVHAIAGAITIVVLAVFFLMFGEGVFDQGLQWLPLDRRAHVKSLAARMSHVVSGYVAGTAIVATIGGIVMGITMAILGVPYFLPLGLLMVMLGVIPVIGTSIAAIVIVGVTFATAGSTPGFICAGVYLAYQQVENHVLQPIVQTRTLKMNPLLIVLALIIGTGLAGVLGAILALPIAGAVQVLLEDVLARRQVRAASHGT